MPDSKGYKTFAKEQFNETFFLGTGECSESEKLKIMLWGLLSQRYYTTTRLYRYFKVSNNCNKIANNLLTWKSTFESDILTNPKHMAVDFSLVLYINITIIDTDLYKFSIVFTLQTLVYIQKKTKNKFESQIFY